MARSINQPEALGEIIRAVELELAANVAQRRLAHELHRDGNLAVADRKTDDAERAARIRRRDGAVE